jgi:hypothetical protein
MNNEKRATMKLRKMIRKCKKWTFMVNNLLSSRSNNATTNGSLWNVKKWKGNGEQNKKRVGARLSTN